MKVNSEKWNRIKLKPKEKYENKNKKWLNQNKNYRNVNKKNKNVINFNTVPAFDAFKELT